jgi:tRNA-Thr(GGU) m(6)t(6)A37 methyltransferase TsaA
MVRLNEMRAGESVVEIALPTDAAIVFIGRIHTPWTDRLTCPRQGRQDGPTCRIQVFEPWVAALDGVTEYERLEVLYWLHESRRDLVRQSPRNDGIARGTFSLRTPARPNPIGTQIVKLLRVDSANVFVRGLDCLDGTPLLDLKPDRCAFTPLAPRQPGDDQVGDPG